MWILLPSVFRPLDEHQQPDISYVRSSTEAVSKYLKKGTMVVLESTTYPGTTEELIKTNPGGRLRLKVRRGLLSGLLS